MNQTGISLIVFQLLGNGGNTCFKVIGSILKDFIERVCIFEAALKDIVYDLLRLLLTVRVHLDR